MRFALLQFSAIFAGCGNPLKRWASSIPEPRQRVSWPLSIRIPPDPAGDFSMTITAAHVPAIVALLAGVLILIMPRFLNFIVAIYLILIGLHGLGFLRMFHM
jgi:hypothetical protein